VDADGNTLTDRMMEILVEDLNKTRVKGSYNCKYFSKLLVVSISLIIVITHHSKLVDGLLENKTFGA